MWVEAVRINSPHYWYHGYVVPVDEGMRRRFLLDNLIGVEEPVGGVNMCPECGCVLDDTNEPTALACLVFTFVPCECGHFRCQGCNNAFTRDMWVEDTELCRQCHDWQTEEEEEQEEQEQEEESDKCLVPPLPVLAVLPFHYRPRWAVRNGRVWELDEYDRSRLERHVLIQFYGGHAPQLVEREGARVVFEHYHCNCWGGVATTPEAGQSYEDVARRLESLLETVNGDSLAHRQPSGLPDFDDLGAGVDMSTWEATPGEIYVHRRTERQRTLNLAVPRSVAIIGCGGVGWHVAKSLVMAGTSHVLLCDPDTLEHTNANRIDFSSYSAGAYKALVLCDELLGMNPTITVVPVPKRFLESGARTHYERMDDSWWEANLERCGLLVDCTDDLSVQQQTWAYAQEHGLRWVRVGYDGGWHVTVTSRRPPGWDARPNETYAVPAWVAGAAIAAQLGLIKLCYNPAFEYSGDIREAFNVSR